MAREIVPGACRFWVAVTAGQVRPAIALVSGSLRVGSTNTAVLRTAQLFAPVNVECDLYRHLADLPAFNPDDDQPPLHPKVARLRGTIHHADALLFSTPEYAGALPGAFKNPLDWTIGDDEAGSIDGKAVGWINTSPREAAGAHEELRTGARLRPRPDHRLRTGPHSGDRCDDRALRSGR